MQIELKQETIDELDKFKDKYEYDSYDNLIGWALAALEDIEAGY